MKVVGYKVMGFQDDGETIRSGRNGNLTYGLDSFKEGNVIEMPENACYLGMDKDYVMDYYSGLAEKEILLKLEFDSNDIITGDITDKEPELSVSKVHIVEAHLIEDGEITNKISQKETKKTKRKRKTSNRY